MRGEQLVGRQVRVWWSAEGRFLEAVVERYDAHNARHVLDYLDDDALLIAERLTSRSGRWELLTERDDDRELESDFDDSEHLRMAQELLQAKEKAEVEARAAAGGS